MKAHSGNPFSTRHTRPGAIAFQFEPGQEAATIVERLRRQGWRGQIVGPHGSGKSTLLATLRPALEAAGREVRLVQLKQSDPAAGMAAGRLFAGKWFGGPLRELAWRQVPTATQVVIDGFEQLATAARWRVVRRCRRRGCGLLVTTHYDLGLPTIYTTQPRLELALALSRRLSADQNVIHDADVEAAWRAHHGNLREVLFTLYDLYEQRGPRGP